jgi:hypothetical protein
VLRSRRLRQGQAVPNVHAGYQSTLEPITVADRGVGEEIAGFGVVDDLMTSTVRGLSNGLDQLGSSG